MNITSDLQFLTVYLPIIVLVVAIAFGLGVLVGDLLPKAPRDE